MSENTTNNQRKKSQDAYKRLSGHKEIGVFASNIGSINLAKAGQRMHGYHHDLMEGLTIGSFPESRKKAVDDEVSALMEEVNKRLSNIRKLTRNARRVNRPTASKTKKKVAQNKQKAKQEKIQKATENAEGKAA